MIRWVVRLVGVFVALVLLMAVAGWLLPVGHQASITRTLPAPPTAVFDAIATIDRDPQWPFTVRITRADRPVLLQTRVEDPDGQFGGTWTFVLVPDGTGTRLTITEDGEVYNPIFRFLSRFVLSRTATMEEYAAGLEARWQG
jgi:uncharacterized protein YndB with AHSA1/START domain